jgi:hypothetical protein
MDAENDIQTVCDHYLALIDIDWQDSCSKVPNFEEIGFERFSNGWILKLFMKMKPISDDLAGEGGEAFEIRDEIENEYDQYDHDATFGGHNTVGLDGED